MLETVLRLFLYLNHAANFFCYCISGKRFKSELIAMVKGWLGSRILMQKETQLF